MIELFGNSQDNMCNIFFCKKLLSKTSKFNKAACSPLKYQKYKFCNVLYRFSSNENEYIFIIFIFSHANNVITYQEALERHSEITTLRNTNIMNLKHSGH